MSNHHENRNDAEEIGGIFFVAVAVIGCAVLLFCVYGIVMHIIDYVL